MKNIDAINHVRGTSIYLDDIPLQQGTLFAAVFDSPVAHAQQAARAPVGLTPMGR